MSSGQLRSGELIWGGVSLAKHMSSMSPRMGNEQKLHGLTVADAILTNECKVPLGRKESRLYSLLSPAGLAKHARGGRCIYYASLANRSIIFAVCISSRVVCCSSAISLCLVDL